MNNTPSKLIGILLTGLFVGGLGLFIYTSLQPGETKLPAAGVHDETNSDGHHNKDSESLGGLVDLTNQAAISMDIKDFKYTQPNIKIKKGTTVTWTNRDDVKHNVMKEHDDDDAAHDAPTLDEVRPGVFAGQLLAKGESYSFTFNEVSTAPYHCSPHPYMKGSVTVVE